MPDIGKQQVVIEYIERFSIHVFAETGTHKGKMVYAVIPHVKEVYSIEIDETHFQNARKRFAGYSNIHILQGQSGKVLPKVLKDIGKPRLFWLVAHWLDGSNTKDITEMPIMQEIECILNHKRASDYIILIDNARRFTCKDD